MGSTITVSHEQPFESRVGEDTIVMLRFGYNPEAVTAIKGYVREHRAEYPRGKAFHAGGWLPDKRAWFVEERLWPQLAQRLSDLGYVMRPQ